MNKTREFKENEENPKNWNRGVLVQEFELGLKIWNLKDETQQALIGTRKEYLRRSIF